jgi:pyruvate carboxylase
MLAALRASHVDGVETNIDLLQRILQDSRFRTQGFFTRSLDNDILLTQVKEASWDDTHQKLLSFFTETLINGTQVQGQVVSRLN